MNRLRIIALIAAGYLGYRGYTEGLPSNEPTIPVDAKIEVVLEQESYAPIADAELAKIAQPIVDTLKGNPADAIKLARVFHQWADLIGRSKAFKTTKDFHDTYQNANVYLFSGHPLAGKYKGALNATFDSLMAECFRRVNLTDSGGIKAADWSPDCQTAAISFFNAVSSSAFDAFVQGSISSPGK